MSRVKSKHEGATRHPQGQRIDVMQAEDVERMKAAKGVTTKHATLVKAGTVPEGVVAAPSEPTDEQLAKINEFTRTPKAAEELYVFDTLSMNNLADRDDDYFFTETVQEFAELPQPFSPVGKSFMVDHDYKVGNAMGRIFDVGTVKVDDPDVSGSKIDVPDGGDVLFLRNGIYIPNTAKNAGFIEDLDFGINWAVSVGVTLGATECSVCKSPFSSWGYWCREGHDKGLYYDPSSEETDDWGYPLPVDPETSGAIKCLRGFKEARDMYELSQVFLGAQYFAALDRTAGVSKSVFGGFSSVSEEKAKEIPFPEEDPRVAKARKKGLLKTQDDGSVAWTDEDGISWTFDTDEGVLCLGRTDEEKDSDNTGEEEADGSDTDAPEQGSADGEGVESSGEPDEDLDGLDGPSTADGTEERAGSSSEPVIESADDSDEDDDESDNGVDDSDDSDEDDSADDEEDEGGEGEEGSSTQAAASERENIVRSFAALLPENMASSVKASDPASVVKALTDHIATLQTEAEHGREYVQNLRADALSWYVKANMVGTGGVKTAAFEKLLDRVGPEVDLLKDIIEEQKEQAQKRWPSKQTVRRSSVPREDLNDRREVPEVNDFEAQFGTRAAESLHK